MSEPQDHDTGVPVRGELVPPAGRRRLYALIVRRCPYCAHCHIHRVGAQLDVYVRRAGCASWRFYAVHASVPASIPALHQAAA